MFPITFWLQLLLLVLVLRQSPAASGQCIEKQSEISRLEEPLNTTTSQKHTYEIHDGDCHDLLTKQIYISQKTDALNHNLKKQLEAKEEVLKANNEKQTQMQTAIDGLTKTVESLNQKAGLEIGQWKTVHTAIDGLTKMVESINQTLQVLCRSPKHVCRALLEAVKSGDVDSAKKWVSWDSSDNCTDDDEDRSTPLTYAASSGQVEVVRVLLDGGANVDRADAQQRTGLHLAAGNGHLEVCRLLLDRGAKVNALDKWKTTPLHEAAWTGHLPIVKLLVERGADVSLKNNNGVTPVDLAQGLGKQDVAEYLESVSRDKRH